MGNPDDIARELRQIEHELIELELAARGNFSVTDKLKPTAADHAQALLAEIKRIARVASRRSAD